MKMQNDNQGDENWVPPTGKLFSFVLAPIMLGYVALVVLEKYGASPTTGVVVLGVVFAWVTLILGPKGAIIGTGLVLGLGFGLGGGINLILMMVGAVWVGAGVHVIFRRWRS